MFQEVLNAIREFDRIILHRHGRPDGDAMGSQVGLKYVILENFPEKTVYMVGDKPGFFGFMVSSCFSKVVLKDTPETTLSILFVAFLSVIFSKIGSSQESVFTSNAKIP